MKTYSATFIETGRVIYTRKPNGNLIGELPMGAKPKAKMEGEINTVWRSDVGDVFECALFDLPSGRVIKIALDD